MHYQESRPSPLPILHNHSPRYEVPALRPPCSIRKPYVHNRSRPEGSLAEGYLLEECSTFCSRYLHEVETKFNRPVRNYDDSDAESHEKIFIFIRTSRTLGKATSRTLSKDE
ncbi:hypothetical protein AAC387_Pa09g1166 [Persea americana]